MSEPPTVPPTPLTADPMSIPDRLNVSVSACPSPADGAPAGPARRALVILGLVAMVTLLAVALGPAASRPKPLAYAGVSPTGLRALTSTTYPTAPIADVQSVHTALHDMALRATADGREFFLRAAGCKVAFLADYARFNPAGDGGAPAIHTGSAAAGALDRQGGDHDRH